MLEGFKDGFSFSRKYYCDSTVPVSRHVFLKIYPGTQVDYSQVRRLVSLPHPPSSTLLLYLEVLDRSVIDSWSKILEGAPYL